MTTAQPYSTQPLLSHISTSGTYLTDSKVTESRSARVTLFSYISENSNTSPEQAQDFTYPALVHAQNNHLTETLLPEAVIKKNDSQAHTHTYTCI